MPDVCRPLELLRLTAVGSVDDGKSTLIGRLLYESNAVLDDQLQHVVAVSRRLGDERTDLALLMDGLRAEREQRITIDVAHRYFSTARRRFIIADVPGHVQYTRNMVTGASTADIAVLLIDVTKGVLTQSRRHAFISSLLGIPHLIVAVNKMDCVGYAREAFDSVVHDFTEFASKLTLKDITFVPVSALEGDNVITRSSKMAWYEGGSLLHRLETVPIGGRTNAVDLRFPVQYVIRPTPSFRGYAGSVASGTLRVGDEVVVLPSGWTTRIATIETYDGKKTEAMSGDAVVLTTADALDISRGDLIVRRGNLPESASHLDVYLCWVAQSELTNDRPYLLRHTTRQLQAYVTRIDYLVDMATLHRQNAHTLKLNDVARVEIRTGQPLLFDSYRVNAATGSFVLIDPHSNVTVAAGMVRGPVRALDELKDRSRTSHGARAGDQNVAREEWEERNRHLASVIWLTGLPASGKTTIARALQRRLFERGCRTVLLDGDQLRQGLSADLGFSPSDRAENIRRAGEVARLFFAQGNLVICAFISPYRADRERVRALLPEGRFIEVHVKASIETCTRRDRKGLYARAREGALPQLTGLSAPYEEPQAPDVVIDNDTATVDSAIEQLLAELTRRGLLADG